MKNSSQKGFVVPLIIALIVIVGAGVIYYSQNQKGNICWPYCPNMTDQDREAIKENWLDGIRASVDGITSATPTQSGANKIVYLKFVDGTAYVLLAMDVDGWAGVSFAIAKIHPIVEQALLTHPEITAVKFGPAPGDTIQEIMKEYSDKVNDVSNTELTPVITSVTPVSGPVGTAVTVKGTNLAGLEGDKNLWIENVDLGVKGIIYGDQGSTDSLIKFTLAGKYCSEDNSYSGKPCTSYLNLDQTPGAYVIYANPWGKVSNKVNFIVTGSVTVPVISSIDFKESDRTADGRSKITIRGTHLGYCSNVKNCEIRAHVGSKIGTIADIALDESAMIIYFDNMPPREYKVYLEYPATGKFSNSASFIIPM